MGDQQNGRIQMFSLDGEFLGQWGSRETISGLAVDDQNRLFVSSADGKDNNLQQLDIDGEFLVIRGGRSFGEPQLSGPAESLSGPELQS